jgi:hypothetical protein
VQIIPVPAEPLAINQTSNLIPKLGSRSTHRRSRPFSGSRSRSSERWKHRGSRCRAVRRPRMLCAGVVMLCAGVVMLCAGLPTPHAVRPQVSPCGRADSIRLFWIDAIAPASLARNSLATSDAHARVSATPAHHGHHQCNAG